MQSWKICENVSYPYYKINTCRLPHIWSESVMAGIDNFRDKKSDGRNRFTKPVFFFFAFFQSDNSSVVLYWLREHDLLAPSWIKCPKYDRNV